MLNRLKNIIQIFQRLVHAIVAWVALLPSHTQNKRRIKGIYENRFPGKILALLPDQVFGAYIMFAEYFLRYCSVHGLEPKKDVVFIGHKKAVNRQIQVMLNRSANVILDNKLHEIIDNGGYRYLRKINRMIPDDVPEDIKNGIIYYPDCKVNLNFTEDEVSRGQNLLKELGVKEDQPFVCLSNKDQTYWKSKRGIEKPNDCYRDTAFHDLNKTIQFLNSKGYAVIRCGHYENEGGESVISIMSHQQDDKDFLDIFLQKYCLFSICGGSGIAFAPWLHKTQILYHNFIPMDESPTVERGIIIPKLLKRKGIDRYMTISEIRLVKERLIYFERGKIKSYLRCADSFQGIGYYQKRGIEVIDNTPEEVLAGVKEMELLVRNELQLSKEQKELQHRFKNLFPPYHSMRQMGGIVSPSFLEKHSEILN